MRWINTKPNPGLQLTLMLAPFVLLVIAYGLGSAARLADNPSDKLLPALASLTDAVNRMAFTPDVRTGDYLMWSDTAASLSRLLWALGISTAIALVLGMVVGMFPYARAFLAPFIATVSMVPPLALLPVLSSKPSSTSVVVRLPPFWFKTALSSAAISSSWASSGVRSAR